MKRLDIALDIETLGKTANSAIIAIAAKVFSLEGDEVKSPDNQDFNEGVDATNEIMLGFDIDVETVKWWQSQPQEAKDQFSYTYNIRYVLNKLSEYINKAKEINGADKISVWCQGTDFDIAIMRNAYRRVFGTEDDMAWNFHDATDSRTYIMQGARLLSPETEDPYSLIPKLDGVKHVALFDCKQLIHNVTWIAGQLKKLNSPEEPKAEDNGTDEAGQEADNGEG